MKSKYLKSPLIEVVADFQFEKPTELDLMLPGAMYERLKDEFPIQNQVNILGGIRISNGPAGAFQQIVPQTRMQFLRSDGSALIQIGPDVMAINHLQPYEAWEVSFRPILKRGWQSYQEAGGKKGLQGISLRYINRIKLPNNTPKSCDFENYLEFRPHCGPRLKKDHGPFLVMVTYPYRDGNDLLTLQLQSESFEAEHTTFLLELMFRVQAEMPSADFLMDWFEGAHGHIHEVFESCLTDKLRVLLGRE